MLSIGSEEQICYTFHIWTFINSKIFISINKQTIVSTSQITLNFHSVKDVVTMYGFVLSSYLYLYN